MNKIAGHLPHQRKGCFFLFSVAFFKRIDSFPFKFSKYLILSVQNLSSNILSIPQFSTSLSLSSSYAFWDLSVNDLCLHPLIHCNNIQWPIASFCCTFPNKWQKENNVNYVFILPLDFLATNLYYHISLNDSQENIHRQKAKVCVDCNDIVGMFLTLRKRYHWKKLRQSNLLKYKKTKHHCYRK